MASPRHPPAPWAAAMLISALGALSLGLLAGDAARRSFRDRVAVITGGSRGLGLLLARRLVSEGARVALLARDRDELRRAVDELRPRGTVMALVCDVTDRASVDGAIDRVVDAWGGVDLLFNVAGQMSVGPVEQTSEDDFETQLDVSMRGALYAIRACLPHLKRSADPHIVNVSSIAGKVAIPHMSAYSAAKHALAGYSEALHAELAPQGIHVMTVFPGILRTGGHVHAHVKGDHEAEYTWFSALSGLPGMSMSADLAADRILAATKRRKPALILGAPARLLILSAALAPQAVAAVARVIEGWAMPSPVPGGEVQREGADIGPTTPLSAPADAAADRNNERKPRNDGPGTRIEGGRNGRRAPDIA